MIAPSTPATRPSTISTNLTSRSVAPSDASMPRARCLRWAITVNAADATSPMKARPSTETISTIVAGDTMVSVGCGAVTVAFLGMTLPAADAAAESIDIPRKIRTFCGGDPATWPGGTRANSSSRFDGFSTMPVTIKARPALAPAEAGTCQTEPIRSP